VSVSAIVVSPSGILVGDAALDEASISGYAVAFSRASSILIDPKVSGCSRAHSTSPCGSGSSNRRVLLLAGGGAGVQDAHNATHEHARLPADDGARCV